MQFKIQAWKDRRDKYAVQSHSEIEREIKDIGLKTGKKFF